MAKVGRPSVYSDDLADAICEDIATSNIGLYNICKANEAYPSTQTIYTWLKENKEFLDKYARARELQAEFLADEIIEIADLVRIGSKTKETKDGVFEETGDMVERSRLMVDARKWKASKLAPKKYGDKLELTAEVKAEITEIRRTVISKKV